MSSLAEQQAELAKGQAKIKKFFAALQKLLAKEFLWVLFILLLGIPLAFVFTFIVNNFATPEIMDVINKFLKDTPLFIGAYGFSLIGIYFARTVAGSIQTLVKKEEGS